MDKYFIVFFAFVQLVDKLAEFAQTLLPEM